MADPRTFALQNSDLNTFIFADIGTEQNGSTLTMLSMLARLGGDPWAEAATLAKLPKNEAFDYLLKSIAKMPLDPMARADMRATASRLLLLLPGQTKAVAQIAGRTVGALTMPQWLPIVLIGASLVFGMILNMLPASVTGVTASMPMAQSVHPATATPAEPIPPQRN